MLRTWLTALYENTLMLVGTVIGLLLLVILGFILLIFDYGSWGIGCIAIGALLIKVISIDATNYQKGKRYR